jgi:hypothetical protein
MALIRKSPSNRTTVSPATSGQAGISKQVDSPYVTPTPGQVAYLQAYADKYKIAKRLPAGSTSDQIITAAKANLVSRTSYLQPTTADLAKGQFGAATGGATGSISLEQYKSQKTSLSAATAIGKQLGIKTAASSPAPGGAGSVTPQTFAAFQKDIQLEEMFGMLGSGSAANIRLAAAQTGASIPSLIALENKTLGIRQVGAGKAAFSYDGSTFDVEGNLFVEPTKTGSVAGIADFSQEATTVAADLKPSGGTSDLTQFANGIKIGSNTMKPTLNEPKITNASVTGIATTVVAPSGTDAGSQYRSDFVKATGVDIFKPLIAPTTVKAIKDITGISQGKAPTLQYADFLGKLTAPGGLAGGKFEGVRYADLYEPVSAGSSTLKLTSAGTAFRNLQIKGTPGINLKLR